MAAKYYVIRSIKKKGTWKGSYGDMQDYALGLKGLGEPVKLTLPQPILEDPEIGDTLYGKLFEEKSNDGRRYYVLKLEKVPAEEKRTLDIHAQGAVKLAVNIWLNTTYASDQERSKAYDNIKDEAVHFARMIQEVREDIS